MFKYLNIFSIFKEIHDIRHEVILIRLELVKNTKELEELKFDTDIVKTYIKKELYIEKLSD